MFQDSSTQLMVNNDVVTFQGWADPHFENHCSGEPSLLRARLKGEGKRIAHKKIHQRKHLVTHLHICVHIDPKIQNLYKFQVQLPVVYVLFRAVDRILFNRVWSIQTLNGAEIILTSSFMQCMR